MSIATDEAERRYLIEYSNFDCDVSKLSACRRAFALGAEWQSQREPTEAETWIIARALYEHYADLEFCSEVSDDEWERFQRYYIKTPMQCSEFIKAKEALTAARKAVTE